MTTSVDFHGAVGDGQTDDTNAVAAAINAASEHDRIIFPPGRTYRVTGTLTPKAGQILWGYNSAIATGENASPVFDCVNDGISVIGLRFIGPDTAGSAVQALGDSRAIRVSGHECTIRDCRIEGHFFGGIIVNGSHNLIDGNHLHGVRHWTGADHRGAILVNGGENNIVSNNRLTEVFDAGICIQASSRHIITNNTIACSAEDGAAGSMGIYMLNGVSYCVVQGNRISGARNEGIMLSTGGMAGLCQHNSIMGNIIEGCDYAGIVLQARSADTTPSYNANNTIVGNTLLLPAATSYGIRLRSETETDHCEFNTVAHNAIVGSLRGVQCSGLTTKAAIIEGNQIRGCAIHGIALPGADHICADNIIEGCATGIAIDASTNVAVRNNIVRNSGANSIEIKNVSWVVVEGNNVDKKVNQTSANGQRRVRYNTVQGVKCTDIVTLVNGEAIVTAGALACQYTDGIFELSRESFSGPAGALYVAGYSGNQVTIKSTEPTDNGIVRWQVIR